MSVAKVSPVAVQARSVRLPAKAADAASLLCLKVNLGGSVNPAPAKVT